MLTLTDSAVTAIRNLTSQPELPDDTGLRIMSQDEGGPAFQVTLADSPVQGDQGGIDHRHDEQLLDAYSRTVTGVAEAATPAVAARGLVVQARVAPPGVVSERVTGVVLVNAVLP